MSGFDQALKNRIRDRDGDACAKCGRPVPRGRGSVHHRLPRGRGGPDIPANLALVCGHATEPGTCHYFVESNRTLAYATGWLLKSGADPSAHPVRCSNGEWWQPGDAWERAERPVDVGSALHAEDEEEPPCLTRIAEGAPSAPAR